ncbi:uncharacterized [Tachysurus ichikawai]
MAHAASQLKKKADLDLAAAEEEKDKKRKTRKRSREVKKKILEHDLGTKPALDCSGVTMCVACASTLL